MNLIQETLLGDRRAWALNRSPASFLNFAPDILGLEFRRVVLIESLKKSRARCWEEESEKWQLYCALDLEKQK